MANRKVKIRYIKAYDFKISLATGIYGGLTTNGLINANFFIERAVIPDSSIIEVDERGVVVGKADDQRDGDVTRELQNGIMLDLNSAKVVVKWLEARIKEHEEKIKK